MAKTKLQHLKPNNGEFGLIAEYFAPLAKSPGALGLLDDGAVLSCGPGQELVMTTDMLVSGVHFLEDADPEEVATKLLAVNVSDLAAMGATPMGYLLVTALTNAQDNNWLSRFAARLDRDQAKYGLSLFGGDTVATPGPLSLTLTAFGAVPEGQSLKRSQAGIGDRIYVSGCIGDSALGLKALQGELPHINEQDREYLINCFKNPQPQIKLGESLRGIAGGVADISDGLVADLGHICEASNVGAKIFADKIPLSNSAKKVLEIDEQHLNTILSGGDDYQLVFTVSDESQSKIHKLAKKSGLTITCIGHMTEGNQVDVIDAHDNIIHLKTTGYEHF